MPARCMNVARCFNVRRLQRQKPSRDKGVASCFMIFKKRGSAFTRRALLAHSLPGVARQRVTFSCLSKRK
jgi:hypothetical protein